MLTMVIFELWDALRKDFLKCTCLFDGFSLFLDVFLELIAFRKASHRRNFAKKKKKKLLEVADFFIAIILSIHFIGIISDSEVHILYAVGGGGIFHVFFMYFCHFFVKKKEKIFFLFGRNLKKSEIEKKISKYFRNLDNIYFMLENTFWVF